MTFRRERPLVSFVVPCYKHGHFLRACVESIQRQTYEHFEVLVMDDCSPDDTPEIARTIGDPRVRHIRNERNLGHLANYNKGITLANGEYVWLLNVDDYLRRDYVLERFVSALERHRSAAYVICPAVRVLGDEEAAPFGEHGPADRVFTSREFLLKLAHGNCVPTPAAMVRKTSYEGRGLFPLDLPYAGDWYQWCSHALFGDVVYLAEPMVCYRIHELNMTKEYYERPAALISDVMTVRARLKGMAETAGLRSVARAALEGMAQEYAFRIFQRAADGAKLGMTYEEFAVSLRSHVHDAGEYARVEASVCARLGDHHYDRGQHALARQYYRDALRLAPGDLRTRIKERLLAVGPLGQALRAAIGRAPATS